MKSSIRVLLVALLSAAVVGTVSCEGDSGTACTSQCTAGERRCDTEPTNRYQVCDDVDGDGCDEWGALTACPAGLVCESGQCEEDNCVNECSPAGALQCAGPPDNGIMVCSNYDGDGCLEWGGYTPCAQDETCSG